MTAPELLRSNPNSAADCPVALRRALSRVHNDHKSNKNRLREERKKEREEVTHSLQFIEGSTVIGE